MNHKPGQDRLKVMVLAGGPDAEREVSLESGKAVASGLEQAGHDVRLCDIMPDDLRALQEFQDWAGDVIFPALHGPWGEGGRLQRLLDDREIAYVGCGSAAGELAMDKQLSKLVFQQKGVPTPDFEFVRSGEKISMQPPVVFKPYNQGSSVGVALCHTQEEVEQARQDLSSHYHSILVERMIRGKELTVGVLAGRDGKPGQYEVLPVIEIVPADTFYDYQAKYQSEQTRYLFDIDLPTQTLEQLKELALEAHHALGCRHLSRVDFMVDQEHRPWCLEVNTMPGFTSHSLLPKAAKQAGIAWPDLLDRLVRLPLN